MALSPHLAALTKNPKPYWQNIPRWKNVGKEDFLSYKWQVSIEAHWLFSWDGHLSFRFITYCIRLEILSRTPSSFTSSWRRYFRVKSRSQIMLLVHRQRIYLLFPASLPM